MEDRICLKCKTKMQPGRLLNNGMVWTGSDKFQDIYESEVKGCEALPAYGVVAYRCPHCKTVELYTPDSEKA